MCPSKDGAKDSPPTACREYLCPWYYRGLNNKIFGVLLIIYCNYSKEPVLSAWVQCILRHVCSSCSSCRNDAKDHAGRSSSGFGQGCRYSRMI